ncbi:terminase small subunit [Clostridium botulinum]|uniref:terminase small subunit n=1 Tax=Clostridium botulinum TaxID=1491 RepID=UPI0004D46756|nr:terminase small subunit [Clostridium botulinum]KEH90605.1 hypothetical protein Z963_11885 [Clostridium botulinum C/D str. It1]
MVDIRGPDQKEQAKQDYLKGMKYKDLAEKYSVSLNTIKSWVKRYNWSEEKKQKGAHKSNRGAPLNNKSKNNNKEPIAEEVKEVLENTELTDKQRLFCVIYSRCLNATKAYKKAYGCSYETAMVEGCKSLRNPKINEQIEKLNATQFNKEFIKKSLIQKYIDIAFSDITDYVKFGQEEIPVMGAFGPVVDKETGEPITKIVNTVKFKESVEVDGTIVSEVKQGKDGASIKLQDKMKALQWLSDRLDLLPTETRIKLDNEKAKVQIAQEKLSLEKSKVTGDDGDTGDDGFLEALKETITEVWDNE